MKLLYKILILPLLYGATNLVAQGEFYTINHDTQIILKSSAKSTAKSKHYSNEDEEDIVIFRNGLDRAIKLKGRLDLISNNIDFNISNVMHSIPLDNIDSIYIGFVPRVLTLKEVKVYVNANVLSKGNDYYLESLVDGNAKLYRRSLVKVRRANYNKALDIGSKVDKHIVKYQYFVFTENNKLLEIPKGTKSRKKLLRYYKDTWLYFEKKDLAEQLLDCKNERDLELLIKKINKQKG